MKSVKQETIDSWSIDSSEIFTKAEILSNYDAILKDYTDLENAIHASSDLKLVKDLMRQRKNELLKECDLGVLIYDGKKLIATGFVIWSKETKEYQKYADAIKQEKFPDIQNKQLCVLRGLRVHPDYRRQGLAKKITRVRSLYAKQFGMQPVAMTSLNVKNEAGIFHKGQANAVMPFKVIEEFKKKQYGIIVY